MTMMFDKIIKFMIFIIIIFVIYSRDHYQLLLIAGIIFMAYKFDLHNKVYKLINKISGNTNNVRVDKNKKSKYLKKYLKNRGSEI
ncbi:unnamed protein product [marine sediment metagenome]|uniref:Uncharacterized protein n=1 Tax=marine sediment metagenome TaxID=412755 RepID=X1HKI6_9ZZZZ